MKELLLTLTAEEPLITTSGAARQMGQTCPGYIAGNLILGAMAKLWRELNPDVVPDDSSEFHALFLDNLVSWGHALPVCENMQAVPVPTCYRYNKQLEALPMAGSTFNAQAYWVCNLLGAPDGVTPQNLWEEEHGDAGFKSKRVEAGFMNPQTLHLAPLERVFSIHVALGKSRAALNSQLFSYSALAAGTILQSRVTAATKEAEDALLALVPHMRTFHVGHARTAGYGKVSCKVEIREARRSARAPKKDYTLFLVSQFMPDPTWADPYECLLRELEARTGEPAQLLRPATAICEIQGYNHHWNRPRQTRIGLEMGGALQVAFAHPVPLLQHFSLGGAQGEGYGRIWADPPFLMEAVPVIAPALEMPKATTSAASAPVDSPLWHLWRERSAARLLAARITETLNSDDWQNFLETATSLSIPSPSQRNNLRNMDRSQFEKMLEKTPGRQWKEAVAYCPFRQRKDHLDTIIRQLLTLEKFLQICPVADLNLPGGQPREKEKAALEGRAHALFIRQLVSLWNKKANYKEKE